MALPVPEKCTTSPGLPTIDSEHYCNRKKVEARLWRGKWSFMEELLCLPPPSLWSDHSHRLRVRCPRLPTWIQRPHLGSGMVGFTARFRWFLNLRLPSRVPIELGTRWLWVRRTSTDKLRRWVGEEGKGEYVAQEVGGDA